MVLGIEFNGPKRAASRCQDCLVAEGIRSRGRRHLDPGLFSGYCKGYARGRLHFPDHRIGTGLYEIFHVLNFVVGFAHILVEKASLFRNLRHGSGLFKPVQTEQYLAGFCSAAEDIVAVQREKGGIYELSGLQKSGVPDAVHRSQIGAAGACP